MFTVGLGFCKKNSVVCLYLTLELFVNPNMRLVIDAVVSLFVPTLSFFLSHFSLILFLSLLSCILSLFDFLDGWWRS